MANISQIMLLYLLNVVAIQISLFSSRLSLDIPLSGFSVDANHTASRSQENVTFEISMKEGSHFNITLSEDDGQILQVIYSENSTDIPPMWYAFPAGNHTLTFTANNTVSSLVSSLFLITQDPLDSVEVTASCSQRNCSLDVRADEDVQKTCSYDYGDETAVSSTPDHEYEFCGSYVIVTECSNLIDSVKRELNVSVSVDVNVTVTETCDLTTCTFKWQVDPATEKTICRIAFGDSHFELVAEGDQSEHTYENAGRYGVNVRCYGPCFDDVRQINRMVLGNITGLHVNHTEGPIAAGDILEIYVSILTGGYVNVTIEFDEGLMPAEHLVLDSPTYTFASNSIAVVTPMPPSGWLRVDLHAANGESNQTTSFYVVVEMQISSVNVDELHGKKYARVGETLSFDVMVAEGTNVTCKAIPGDGQITTPVLMTPKSGGATILLSITYDQAGNYTPSFNLTNPVSSHQLTYRDPIVVQQIVESIKVLAPLAAEVGKLITYSTVLNTTVIPTNPFCRWQFADGTETTVYAEELANNTTLTMDVTYKVESIGIGGQVVQVNCSNLVSWSAGEATVLVQATISGVALHIENTEIALVSTWNITTTTNSGSDAAYEVYVDDDNVIQNGTISPKGKLYNSVTFQISHTFNTEGNYTIHVNISNEVSYESASLSVYVQEPLQGFNISHVMPYNGGVVMFTVHASNRAEHVFFYWTFGDDSPQLNEYASQVSDTVTYLKPHRYTPGQYNVTLVCYNLISTVFLSLNVSVPKKGGLTAHIENNNARLVPYNSTITMNAIDVTEDLDERQGNLSFVWYCRKKEGEDHVEDMPTAPIVALPAEGNSSFVRGTGGGCFGYGPGQLNISDSSVGKFSFKARFLSTNTKYIMAVRVRTLKEESLALQELRVSSVGLNPPTVTIRCRINCQASVNPDADYEVVGSCKKCASYHKLEFKWILRNTADETNQTLGHYANVLISAGTLNPGIEYFLTLTITISGENGSGMNEVKIYASTGPKGGRCEINPRRGDGFRIFNATCEEWEDGTDMEAQRLWYEYAYVLRGVLTPLFTGLPMLPPGDKDDDYTITFIFYIINVFGAKTEIRSNVTVVPNDTEIPKLNEDDPENLPKVLNQIQVIASAVTPKIKDGNAPKPEQNITGAHYNASKMLTRLMRVINALAKMQNSSSSYNITLLLENAQSFYEKLPTSVSAETKEEALRLIAIINDKLLLLNSTERKDTIEHLLSYTNEVLSKIDLDPAVHEKEELDLDEVPDEEAEERAQRKEREKLKEKDKLISSAAEKTLGLLRGIHESMEHVTVIGELPIEMGTDDQNISTVMQACNMKDVDIETSSGGAVVHIPACNRSGDVKVSVSYVTRNLFPASQEVDSEVVHLRLTEQVSDSPNTKSSSVGTPDLSIDLRQREAMNVSELNVYNGTVRYNEMIYHRFIVDFADSAIIMQVDNSTDLQWQVYFKFYGDGDMTHHPSTSDHDFHETLPTNQMHQRRVIVVPEEYVKKGLVWIGILVQDDMARRRKRDVRKEPSFKLAIVRCRALDKDIWIPRICTVSRMSNLEVVKCKCTDVAGLSSFTTGFTAPKVNTIDFRELWNNIDKQLLENMAVYCTVLAIVVVYVLLLVWARRMDRRDIEKWAMIPLIGNTTTHQHRYKLSVFTGLRRNAGTTSNVSFFLVGDPFNTGVRLMNTTKKRAFTRGSVRNFVMTTDQSLGDPLILRIWHDNSGKGANASWFLDKVVVEDLATSDRFFFLCGMWLASDEDDGRVDRTIPVTYDQDDAQFGTIFFSNARARLTDDHLWLSVVARPTHSTFTRIQRLTCCMTLLFTTMVSNAMWYKTDNVEHDQVIRFGPVVFSAATILVSVYSSLLVIPVNLSLVQLFRKSKPADWDEETGKGRRPIVAGGSRSSREYMGHVYNCTGRQGPNPGVVYHGGKYGAVKEQAWWKQPYPLPHLFVYIAWTLAVIIIVVSAFFIIAYSLDFGKSKSDEWLSALLFSFVESVFLVQPFKVMFTAMLLALIFHTLVDDMTKIRLDNASDEDTNASLSDMNNSKGAMAPPSRTNLARARRKRMHDKRMWSAIREIVMYIFFLTIVSFIAWGTKNDTFFMMNNSVMNLYNGGNGTYKSKWVTNTTAFWRWCNETVVPQTYGEWNYTRQRTTRRYQAFLADMTSFRVGVVRMRQVRVKPASCDVVHIMRHHAAGCRGRYSVFDEEKRNFGIGWSVDKNGTGNPRLAETFKYHSMMELQGMPTHGKRGLYGGGGYVADLGKSQRNASRLMEQLIRSDWIDVHTRAIFIEFTVYNPNVNLFAFVNMLMEFPHTGGVVRNMRVDSFHVYSGVGTMGSFLVFVQFVFVIILVYMAIRELLKFKNHRQEYFKEPWNYVEVAVIVTSTIAVTIYVAREFLSRYIMDQLNAQLRAGNKDAYTNYSTLAESDNKLTIVVGAVIFLTNIKFLRLLRFNKHISQFANTLRRVRRDLASFGVIFGIVFVAFAMSGYLVLGRERRTFSTFANSLQTLFAMLIGKFDLVNITGGQVNSILVQLFFVTFSLVVFFILVNVFLGILLIGYKQTKNTPMSEDESYDIMRFLHRQILGICSLNKKRTKQHKLPDVLFTPVSEIDDRRRQPNLDRLDEQLSRLDDLITDVYLTECLPDLNGSRI